VTTQNLKGAIALPSIPSGCNITLLQPTNSQDAFQYISQSQLINIHAQLDALRHLKAPPGINSDCRLVNRKHSILQQW